MIAFVILSGAKNLILLFNVLVASLRSAGQIRIMLSFEILCHPERSEGTQKDVYPQRSWGLHFVQQDKMIHFVPPTADKNLSRKKQSSLDASAFGGFKFRNQSIQLTSPILLRVFLILIDIKQKGNKMYTIIFLTH